MSKKKKLKKLIVLVTNNLLSKLEFTKGFELNYTPKEDESRVQKVPEKISINPRPKYLDPRFEKTSGKGLRRRLEKGIDTV